MNNREMIERELEKKGQIIGCYSKEMEEFSTRSIRRIINEARMMDYTDIQVTNNGTKYVVEISQIDNERDFVVKTLSEYRNQYGRGL